MELASVALILLSRTATEDQRARAQLAADDHATALAEGEASVAQAAEAEARRLARFEAAASEIAAALPEAREAGPDVLRALVEARLAKEALEGQAVASVASATKGA